MLCDRWDGVGGRGVGGRGVGGGREVQEEGDILHLWLIHVDVWQKPIQYCKAIILQLKINNLKKINASLPCVQC